MTAESAERLAYGLVELDRETGSYRRVQPDPGSETALINAANQRNALLSSPLYLGNRPTSLR